MKSTVWKFLDFSGTQILCEINFRYFRCPKHAILIYCDSLSFEIYKFLHFLGAEIYPNQNSKVLEIAKTAFFEFWDFPKLISCKT